MKKKYEKPEIEIMGFTLKDRIMEDEGEIPEIDGSTGVEEW